MAKRRSKKRIFKYQCTISGEEFRLTSEAPNPNELVSVNAYYDLHPEEDDRPEFIKKKIESEKVEILEE